MMQSKVIWLTGGSGSGKSTVSAYLRSLGLFVVDCDKIARDILQPGKPAYFETVEKFGRIDILVNNAGVAPKERKDLLEMSEESFDRVLGINTKGTMFLTQLAAKQMIKQEQIFKSKGHIVNVGSCSAEVSSTSRGEYCVSKAAVSMLTTLFADRLAPEGILVNEVRPGVIATDMTSVVTEKYDTMIKNGVFPIARWGKAEDVAEMIAFFCSDSVLYTTGNYVDVDGGFHIKRL